MSRSRLVGAVTVAGLVGLALARWVTDDPAPLPAGTGVVVRVVDGDTVDVDLAGAVERVRLIGIDTPETVDRDGPVECFGAEASTATRTLLPAGTLVRLERDAVARDRYDRLLAYVYRDADDLLVNLALVEGGFADAVTFGDNELLLDRLRVAEAAARDGGRGLWGVCGGPDVALGDG